MEEERKKREGDDEDMHVQICRPSSGNGTVKELIMQRTETETMEEGGCRREY